MGQAMGNASSAGGTRAARSDTSNSEAALLVDNNDEEWKAENFKDHYRAKWSDLLPVRPLSKTWDREMNTRENHDDMLRGKWKALFYSLGKYAAPMFFCGVLTFLCMVFLHVGTYYYVHHMDMLTKLFSRDSRYSIDDFNVSLSMGWRSNATLLDHNNMPKALSYGSLNDPLHAALGFEQVDIGMLDKIAACFPMFFVLLCVLMDELGVWTKVMLCNGLLAVLKGLFGMMTTVPDSKGWQECKARLGTTGLNWMMQERTNPMDFVTMELWGVAGETGQERIRWCADMMFSGHTYFTTLYALGLYELAFFFTREWRKSYRMLALGIVIILAIGEQTVEVYLVLLNRFHYTMDVAMAILLTFLFYTNSAIAQVAKKWVYFGVRRKQHKWTPDMFKEVYTTRLDLERKLKKHGKVGEKVEHNNGNFASRNNYDANVTIIPFKELKSNADVFVPPCCNPCWCCSVHEGTFGSIRHHIFTDDDIGDMLFAASKVQQQEMCEHMRLSMRHDLRSNKFFKELQFSTHGKDIHVGEDLCV